MLKDANKGRNRFATQEAQLVFDAIHILAPNESPSSERVFFWVGNICITSRALRMTITVIVTVLAFFLWQFSLANLNTLYKRSQVHYKQDK